MTVLCFLLILLVSILLSVSNHFFVTSDCWSLQWGKTEWIQFTPVTVFSKRDCWLNWKLAKYTFNHCTYLCKDNRCERRKQTVNASQKSKSVRFHRAEITYFETNRLYAYIKQILQADNMRRNSLLIKVQI